MFRRAVSCILLCMLLAAALTGCSSSAEAEERLSIVVTDFPCYDFTRAVAGEMADITLLIKPGSEVHTYEPAPGDMLSFAEADLFIYIGGESDSWADGMLASMGDDAPAVLRMMDCIGVYAVSSGSGHKGDHDAGHDDDRHEEERHEEERHDDHDSGCGYDGCDVEDCDGSVHEEAEDCYTCEEIIVCEVAGADEHAEDCGDADCTDAAHDHDHAYDEHIWTSPVYAMQMVQSVCDELCARDSANADAYRANAQEYIGRISGIHDELCAMVDSAERNILVFGDRFPFYHMAEEYGLEWHAAFPGCAAETEPSAQTIMELIELVSANGVPAVYVIEMSSGNVASAIADETGAEIVTLHSIQNVTADEFEAGETYVTIMQKNIEALRKGLN